MYQLPPNNIHNWPTTGREGGKSVQTCCIIFLQRTAENPGKERLSHNKGIFFGKKKCVLRRSVQAQDSIDML